MNYSKFLAQNRTQNEKKTMWQSYFFFKYNNKNIYMVQYDLNDDLAFSAPTITPMKQALVNLFLHIFLFHWRMYLIHTTVKKVEVNSHLASFVSCLDVAFSSSSRFTMIKLTVIRFHDLLQCAKFILFFPSLAFC